MTTAYDRPPVTSDDADQTLIAYLRDRQAQHAKAAQEAAAERVELDSEVTRLTKLRDAATARQIDEARLATVLQRHLNRMPAATASAGSGVPAPVQEPTTDRAFEAFMTAVRPSAFLPSEQCGVCLAPITKDEQNGIYHAADGSPAGAACGRRTSL
ncbi:hypothetical protein AB0I81_39930 [Nonomuraea sp. NPDC050404]|uniref:hypothetical protein n=1 Tax=Nonomuraea sp. NPDC050404 TaxID=3155783 RepID=UPI0033F3105A